ncbi:hypothetical protein H2198_001768 [Neophaeococcomyces mojaviensis]|uniref:Uncharacterized protein n=1 Tax=Neophaeococcomyces mojaviensis TaxID=3383035 RepID=A0ACC3AGP2_9EURO|nr:hypothetical protein H2198_001768 [Knufia sp. JES_112]
MAVHHLLASRQAGCDPNDPYCDGGWYYSETGYIIRWVIVAVLIGLVLLFLIGGYLHAQRRMKNNLPPLRYHSWLVSRRQRERFFPPRPQVYYHHAPYGYQHGGYQHGQAVPLNTYGPAPPAYGEHEWVPPYQPPQGGSKVDPDQNYQHHNNGGSSSLNPYPAQLNRAASPMR